MSHTFLLSTAALAVVVIGFAGYGILSMQTPQPESVAGPSAVITAPAATSTGAGEAAPPAVTGYTLAQVGTHANASSCWSAINGKVYDLTSWISQHPGGPENILSICGSDGSAAFNAQHGGEREPARELANFYIGDLQ